VFLLVLRLSNKIVERVFVIFSLIYLSYVVSGIQAKPDWAPSFTARSSRRSRRKPGFS